MRQKMFSQGNGRASCEAKASIGVYGNFSASIIVSEKYFSRSPFDRGNVVTCGFALVTSELFCLGAFAGVHSSGGDEIKTFTELHYGARLPRAPGGTTMPEAQQQESAPSQRPTNPLVALREQLNSRIGEFKHALPPQIPPERFLRVALTAIQVMPELATVDRRSLFNALMKCASDGLVPDGRRAAIVPFRDRDKGQVATYMPMVAGLLARFRNSGQFKALTANVVREGEQFRHWIDEQGEHLLHEPGENDAAPIIKAYAMATTRDGGVAIRV